MTAINYRPSCQMQYDVNGRLNGMPDVTYRIGHFTCAITDRGWRGRNRDWAQDVADERCGSVFGPMGTNCRAGCYCCRCCPNSTLFVAIGLANELALKLNRGGSLVLMGSTFNQTTCTFG